MQPTIRLATARAFLRLALAWFVLSLGVAVASPLVHPRAMELVCSGSGAVKLVVHTQDGAGEVPGHLLDCPLCLTASAPPPAPAAALPAFSPLAHALAPPRAAEIRVRGAAPLSARAPPSLQS